MVERPQMMHWLAAMGHNDKGSFPAEVVDHQLEECVDGERLMPCESPCLSKPRPIAELESLCTSYTSRIGSRKLAAVVDIMLVHDAIE